MTRVQLVTGTDTDVGKTVTTAALVAAHRGLGRSVTVVKPAQTGVLPGEPGDVDEVRRLAGPVDVTEPVRLPDPLAPDTAARLAGVTLPTLAEQRDVVLAAAEGHDVVLVEGAGGILVRVGVSFGLLDLAEVVRVAGLPVEFVVVARAGLGTLNHTGLTVAAIQARGLEVAGVVIGSWPTDPGLAEEQNLLDLPLLTGVPVLGRLPAGAARLDPERFRTAAPGWLPYLT